MVFDVSRLHICGECSILMEKIAVATVSAGGEHFDRKKDSGADVRYEGK